MVESVVGIRAREVRSGHPRFFAYISTIMLLLVFVAFFKSFYFREYSTVVDRLGQRELPLYLIAHGWILTAWYSILCIQAWLGAKRKLQTHRKLGIAGLGVAAAVVLSGALTTIRVVPRDFAAGRAIEGTAGIVIGNFVALAVFVSFVAIAVFLRRRPDIHKRLMLFASMIIMGPAFAGSWSGNRLVGGFFGKISPPVVADFLYIYALALGIVAVIGFDLYSRRRVHKATGWGAAVSVAAIVLALAIQSSTPGLQFVESLR
jgi:hypothetical protein